MWITWKVFVRETCFCEKIQANFTVSWVFQKYFNFRQNLPLPGKDTSPDNFTNPPSVNIFLTTPNVPYISIRANSLLSLELALHFISPPWNRHSSNLWIHFSANKKNSFTPWRSPKPLELPLVDYSNVSTRSKLHLQPMTTRFFLSLNPFLLATVLTNEISSFLYRNQLGSISTSFGRYP